MKAAEGAAADLRRAAIQFAADDVVVQLCERAATAQVYGRLLSDALAATRELPARLPRAGVEELLEWLQTHHADAHLETMRLRHTALELGERFDAPGDAGDPGRERS